MQLFKNQNIKLQKETNATRQQPPKTTHNIENNEEKIKTRQ